MDKKPINDLEKEVMSQAITKLEVAKEKFESLYKEEISVRTDEESAEKDAKAYSKMVKPYQINIK